MTLARLRELYRADVEWLVEGYIARRELTLLVAPPESCKSWAMTDLARAVLTGGQWLKHLPVPQGRALYMEQERAANLVYQTELLAEAYGQNLDELLVIPPGTFRLTDPASQEQLSAWVHLQQPLLVVINSFRAVFTGRPGDGVDTARALGWLGQLAEREGPAIVLVDGTNKPCGTGLARGMAAHSDSLQKEYEADCVLHVERDRDDVGRGTGPSRLYVGKRRAGTAGDPFSYEVVPHHPAGVLVQWRDSVPIERSRGPAGPSAADRVLEVLQQSPMPLTTEAIAQHARLSVGGTRRRRLT